MVRSEHILYSKCLSVDHSSLTILPEGAIFSAGILVVDLICHSCAHFGSLTGT